MRNRSRRSLWLMGVLTMLLSLPYNGVARFANNDPVNSIDPLGLLTRGQVDWLARQWVKGWPGVGPAKVTDIQAAIKTIREKLRELDPKSFKGNVWSSGTADDEALQRLIDQGKLKGFPGPAFNQCWDCKKIKTWIDNARQIANIGDASDAFILAWVMRESSWNTVASAYGWSAGESTGTGLTQITRSFWTRKTVAEGRPKQLDVGWENVVADPALSIAGGLWALQKHQGNTLYDKLLDYGGDNASYVNWIKSGETEALTMMKGKSLDKLTDAECQDLMARLFYVTRYKD